ncbi:MAG: helix-turn-helix domain-containing protein [Haloarculaceae archaeon]
MATITEVRFAHEQGALAGTLGTLDEVEARVLPETSTDPAGTMYVFEFDGVDSAALEAALADDETVATARPMPEFADRTLWGIEFTPETELLAPRVTHQGGFVVDAHSASCESGPEGWHERWLLPDSGAIHDIWEHARAEGFEFEVVDLHRHGTGDAHSHAREALTDEQREALLMAREMGYFSDPREASLEAVADALGHSPSAISGRIKRGMKALIEATLVVERPRP